MTALLIRLSHHDERALHALLRRRRPALDAMMRSITHLGDAVVVIAIAALAAVGIIRDAGYSAALLLAVSHLCVQVVKRSVTRPRPVLPVGILSLVEAPDRFSFPSGHAAASLSIAIALAPLMPFAFGMLMLGSAAVVGISRCYLGVHYPGDILVAWIITITSALLLQVVI